MKKFFGGIALSIFLFLLAAPIQAAGLVPEGCKSGELETCNLTTVEETLVYVARLILGLAGSISLIIFVVGGFRYILSGVRESEAKAAKSMIEGALIGLLVCLFSGVLLTAVIEAIAG
jgi:hypothetical protein